MRAYIKVARQLKIGRMGENVKFRDLEITIETDKGSYRYWKDKRTGKTGKTLMRYPYGYIKKTTGMDSEAIDCFVGPNEKAFSVYVIMTNRPPDFKRPDEQKCMLGFDSSRDAKAAFQLHYDDPGFFRDIIPIPYKEFKEKVFKQTKIAHAR